MAKLCETFWDMYDMHCGDGLIYLNGSNGETILGLFEHFSAMNDKKCQYANGAMYMLHEYGYDKFMDRVKDWIRNPELKELRVGARSLILTDGVRQDILNRLEFLVVALQDVRIEDDFSQRDILPEMKEIGDIAYHLVYGINDPDAPWYFILPMLFNYRKDEDPLFRQVKVRYGEIFIRG